MLTIRVEEPYSVFNKGLYNGLYDYTNDTEVYCGGASSGKSHWVYQKVIFKCLEKWEKPRKILILRKVGASIKDSSFQHCKEILSDLKILPYCPINKSEMSIILPTGGMLMFKGLDDPEKIKSIKGISDVVMEEATEFTQDDFTQLSIRLRDREHKQRQMFLMFNPVSKRNWVYEQFFIKKTNAKVFKSNYKDNQFLDEAVGKRLEELKEQNPAYYKIYGLGEFATLDKLVFNNYEVELIDREKVKDLPIKIGLDFGYVNDPSALVVGRYDKERKIIYIMSEYVKKGMLNNEIAQKIKNLSLHKEKIIADSAEPKSIDEIKRLGVNRIKPAVKGPDSIMHGIQWLQQHKIIIDELCFKTIEEFENYTWKKDNKTGEYINKPNDSFNNTIDAIRYAYNEDIKGKTEAKILSKGELGI